MKSIKNGEVRKKLELIKGTYLADKNTQLLEDLI